MGKIGLMMSVSVDGYIAGPNGELDWHRVDDEVHSYFNERLGSMAAFLEGRVTHELMAEFWPTADRDHSSSPPMVEYSRIWREMPKFVFSRTLDSADWNAVVVHDVVPDEIEALKAEVDGDLSLGGAELGAAFLAKDLVDELWLYVQPVVLGEGKPLFAEPGPHADLRLVETRVFGNGVVLLRYDVDRA
jgi:dihydrofolate reductase